MITVKNLTKFYGKKDSVFKALDDVSFVVPSGTNLAIVGKSGSGKSTLMHLMSGLDRPTDGSVHIDDKQFSTMKNKAVDAFRAKEMSFIFQAFFIQGNQTCYQNVMLPLDIAEVSRAKRKKMVQAALKAVELEDKAKNLANNLSGGQKQRLAIARAIVNKPKLIFADEPTGNLDSATGEKIIELLFELNKKLGCTVVIVTHDHELAARCQMQIELIDGKIVNIKRKSAARKVI